MTARRRNRLLLRLWRWWRRRWSAPVVGAVKGAEFLATHSAMKEVEKAQEERRKRKESGQPDGDEPASDDETGSSPTSSPSASGRIRAKAPSTDEAAATG